MLTVTAISEEARPCTLRCFRQRSNHLAAMSHVIFIVSSSVRSVVCKWIRSDVFHVRRLIIKRVCPSLRALVIHWSRVTFLRRTSGLKSISVWPVDTASDYLTRDSQRYLSLQTERIMKEREKRRNGGSYPIRLKSDRSLLSKTTTSPSPPPPLLLQKSSYQSLMMAPLASLMTASYDILCCMVLSAGIR